jgi:hypothetical protein
MKRIILLLFCFLTQQTYSQPVISSFSPASGPVGTVVTITGNNFNTTPANNIVFFGAVKAVVNTASANSLTVTAPAGTTYQPITVTTGGLTGYSNKPFVVTFESGNLFTENSFGLPIHIPVSLYPYDIAIADLDDDGKSDITITNYGSNTISVLRNISIGDSIIFAPKLDFVTGIFPYNISTADFNGDGKKDIVISNESSASISIYINTSTSGNISFNNKVDFTVGNNPKSISTSDMDNDGKIDVIVANTGSNTISVLRNTTASGVLSFAPRIDYVVSSSPVCIITGDFDGDSKNDIAAVSANDNLEFYIIPNMSTAGAINLGAVQNFNYSLGSNMIGNNYLRAADFNNDGKLDISLIKNVSVLLFINHSSPNNYDFSFVPNVSLGFSSPLESFTNGDLNGDGKVDVSVIGREPGDIYGASQNISINDSIDFINYYYGPFGENNSFFNQIAFGDLNGDGKPESVRLSPIKNLITIVKNKFFPGPHIISFSPTTATTGDTITITGTNFNNIDNVSFGQIDATYIDTISSTIIKAVVGPGNSGNVFVSTIHGTDTLAGFNYIPPPPTITSIDPTYGFYNSGVNIYGNNLIQINSVKFGGVSATDITVISPSHIIASVATGASGYVRVANVSGSDSIGGFIFYVAPTITSFTPSSGTIGDTITIHGVHFSGTQYIQLGNVDVNSFTVISDTVIKAVVGNGATGDVYLANYAGNFNLPGFTYTERPIISSFSPMSAGKSSLVAINGDYFTNTTQVKFGGIAADSFNVVSPQQINAYVGNGATGDIIVQTTIGSDTISGFTFIPLPIISSFTPTSARTGDTVTINGNNFTNINSLHFGNVIAASYTSITPSVLKAVVGLGASGYVKINTAGGVDSLAGFTYLIPPAINSFSPTTGDSGTIVTISGIHFNGTTAVSFGGTPAISFTVISDVVITAVVGNGTTGNITVTTPQGTSSLGTFTVFPYLNTVDLNLCANGNTTIVSNFSGANYQWQLDAGSGFTNISNNTNYTGTTTNTLYLNSIPSAWYGYKYRCFINTSYYSRQTVIKFSNTWTGAVSTAWENPANWSCGTVPDVNTDVIITSGNVVVTSNVVIRSLTLSPGVIYTIISPNILTLLGANSAIGNLGGTPGSCTPFIINGTYNQEVPLNATNTVQIQVNVTATGPYAISTNNTNSGVNFYKAGTFTTTGVQTIILTGSGVPGFSGNQNYTVSFGASTCTFTINFIGAPPNYVPTTLSSNWSYAATSTPDPVDSLYKISLPSFLQFNGQTYREFYEINESLSEHRLGYRKSGSNYYFNYNHFYSLHSLLFLEATGEIKQLDENAPVGGTWNSDITGWVNGGSMTTPIRVQGTVLEKGVSVSLLTGLNFSNVIKVKLDFYDMSIPAFPNFVYSEERWFAFGVGLIYYKSNDPFGTGIIYQLKRYQVN